MRKRKRGKSLELENHKAFKVESIILIFLFIQLFQEYLQLIYPDKQYNALPLWLIMVAGEKGQVKAS